MTVDKFLNIEQWQYYIVMQNKVNIKLIYNQNI